MSLQGGHRVRIYKDMSMIREVAGIDDHSVAHD
jgi:hypothetical protein